MLHLINMYLYAFVCVYWWRLDLPFVVVVAIVVYRSFTFIYISICSGKSQEKNCTL